MKMGVPLKTQGIAILGGIVLAFLQGCDDGKERWGPHSSTDHEILTSTPSSPESLQAKNPQTSFRQPTLEKSKQRVLVASSSVPQEQRNKRENDPSMPRKGSDQTPYRAVHDVPVQMRSSIPQSKTGEDKPLDTKPPLIQATNQRRSGKHPGKVSTEEGKKLTVSSEKNSQDRPEHPAHESKNRDAIDVGSGSYDSSTISVPFSGKPQQHSQIMSELASVKDGSTHSLISADKTAPDNSSLLIKGEEVGSLPVMLDLPASVLMESFEISQTPFPGIEAIAVPATSTKSAVPKQKDVPSKVHVVPVDNHARDVSELSAEQSAAGEALSTVGGSKVHAHKSLEGTRSEEKTSASQSQLQLPPSNFVVTPIQGQAQNADKTDSESMAAGKAKSDTSEALEACEKGRVLLGQQRYQAAITSFSESIRAYRTASLRRAQWDRLQDCYRQRAHTFFQLHDFFQALSDINHVLQDTKFPDQGQSRDFLFRGRVYTATQDSQRAIDDLSTALTMRLSPHDQAMAYYLRGLSYLRLRRLQHGLKDLSEGCLAQHVEACELLEKIL